MIEPEVSVPAFMRNYHEVVRNDLAKVLAPLVAAADLAGFADAWSDYCRGIAVHAAMEDGVAGTGGGLTAMLDHHFDGAAGVAVFREEHEKEHEKQGAVSAALRLGAEPLRDAFADYRRNAEAHLVHEEDVMMPLVQRLPPPKAPKFAEWCFAAGAAHGDIEHFVAHGVRSLAAWGSTKNAPAFATRVFVQSLQAVATARQWRELLPVARHAAPAAIWSSVVAEVPSLEEVVEPVA